jgi:hypothetical protein
MMPRLSLIFTHVSRNGTGSCIVEGKAIGKLLNGRNKKKLVFFLQADGKNVILRKVM